MSTFAAQPLTSRVAARSVLFFAVLGVLVLGAAHQPERENARPLRNEDVVAHVPARGEPSGLALDRLRKSAEEAPAELARALALTRAYIEAARREGDPRYLGAAEAALAPWTAEPDPVAPVRLLRATILQSRHDFAGALVDLERALAQAPSDAQAWLTRATVLTVLGRYDEARTSCARLAGLVTEALRVSCVAPIDALTGHAARASAALEAALVHARGADDLAYLHSLAGELAFWSGTVEASERHLRAALTLAPGDRYTRALYADLMLDAGRAREVLALLREHGSDDALLLRQALAELALGHRTAAVVARVQQGFAESRLRGDSVHQREEARLWLALGDGARALELALQSWAVQREAWDARLVLLAAQVARKPAAAAPVLGWLRATQCEATRLLALANELRG